MKKLAITERNISKLIPADYNPRQLTDKQNADIKDSLKIFGLVDPIIINIHPGRLNTVIGGHQRLRLWSELGNKTIPCVELNLPLEKEKELNIRLNKNTGEFDFDLLANNFDEVDLLEYGFEEYELGIVDEPAEIKEKEFNLIKLNHIMISYPADIEHVIMPLLEEILEISGVSYEETNK